MKKQCITIKVLLTCYNRRDKTIQCLQNLFKQEGRASHFSLNVYLVDDDSKDGTSEAVKKLFKQVTIIKGDGNLFWARGMNVAWTAAAADGPCDYFLWLNDDTFLYPSAITEMLGGFSDNNTIICGSTCAAATGKVTYGGFSKVTDSLLTPNSQVQPCDFFTGNCVLIPYEVFEKVGFLSPSFHHAIGDFDYGLRAIKKGVKCYISSNYVGTCEANDGLSTFFNPQESFLTRLKSLYKSSCSCNPFQRFVFEYRHKGLLVAIFHFCTIHIRVTMPSIWKIKPWGQI